MELGKTEWLCWVSSSPECLIYSHCLISLTQEQAVCHVTRTSGWQKSINEGPIFAEAEWTMSTWATVIDPVAIAFA